MLNSPISEDEVKKAVKRLKNGKACGEDKILNEMIKAFSESHMSVLTNIMEEVILIRYNWESHWRNNEHVQINQIMCHG